MKQRFTHKNILITGAASGMGRAAALRISAEGGHLALIDNNLEGLKSLASVLSIEGQRVVYRVCDVRDFDATQQAIDALSEELGGLHAVSHNAGIMRCYNTHEMTLAQWEEIISVNLTGTFNVNRHALPHLLKNKVSFLVNNASNALVHPHPWLAAYSASKGGIKAMTQSLYAEYTLQGLRANCILPGRIETGLARGFSIPKGANPELVKTLVPTGRVNLVDPDQVGSVIAFLLSEDALHINGTEILVDGGQIT